MRDPGTGLLGNTLHTDNAEWLRKDSGIGAGIDSFYEYLLKVAYLAAHTTSAVMQVLRASLPQHTSTNQHTSHRSPFICQFVVGTRVGTALVTLACLCQHTFVVICKIHACCTT